MTDYSRIDFCFWRSSYPSIAEKLPGTSSYCRLIISRGSNETYSNATFYDLGNNAVYESQHTTGVWSAWFETATTEYAVSKSGDTMNGTLNVAMDGGNAVLVSDAACAYLQTFQDGDWENRRTFLLRNEQSASVENMLAVATKEDGDWKEYPVLHMGNRSLVSTTYYATVTTGWIESVDCWYQNIDVSGILATDNPVVDINPGNDNSANKLYSEAFCKVFRIATENNTIQVMATEPIDIAIPIQLKVVR